MRMNEAKRHGLLYRSLLVSLQSLLRQPYITLHHPSLKVLEQLVCKSDISLVVNPLFPSHSVSTTE